MWKLEDELETQGTFNIVLLIMERNFSLFGHSCIMEKNLLKRLVFGIMDRQTWTVRPNREWLDGVMEWCWTDIHTFTRMAWDRDRAQ